eukprot:COSAG05_NODE_3606_length_1963_cov_68.999515_2_plen_334_part_00
MPRGQTCGAHLFSRDSISWSISRTPVYTREVEVEGGGVRQLLTRQRPQIIFDPDTGQPTTLFNGASFEGNNGNLTDLTHTLAFRFRTKTDDSPVGSGGPPIRVLLPLKTDDDDSTPTGRDTVSFDYGWRFFLGDPAAPQPPRQRLLDCTTPEAAFPVNVSGKAFENLESNSATSATACAAACCALNNELRTTRCWVWQFAAKAPANYSRPKCWLGTPKDKRKFTNDSVFIGFARPTPNATAPVPVPANPPAAATDFDDSDWTKVDTPHDFLISGEYDPDIPPAGINSAHTFTSLGPPGGVGLDYRPRNVGFYRKHFSIPTTWKGSTVSLFFEG